MTIDYTKFLGGSKATKSRGIDYTKFLPKTTTQALGAKTPTTAITAPKVSVSNPDVLVLPKGGVRDLPGTKPLPGFVGRHGRKVYLPFNQGVYSLDPVTDKSKKESRRISTKTRELKTGEFSKTFKELDHLIPVSLAGTRDDTNLKASQSKPTLFQKVKRFVTDEPIRAGSIPEKRRQTDTGTVEKEGEIIDKYKKGELTLNQARFEIVRLKNPPSTNTLKELPRSIVETIFPFIKEINEAPPQELEEAFKKRKAVGGERFLSPKSFLTGEVSEFEAQIPKGLKTVGQEVLKFIAGVPIEFGLDIVSNIQSLAGKEPIKEINIPALGTYRPYSEEAKTLQEENKRVAQEMGISEGKAQDLVALGKTLLIDNTLRALATAGTYGKIGTASGQIKQFKEVAKFDVKGDYIFAKQPTLEEAFFGKTKEGTSLIKDKNGNVGMAKIKQTGDTFEVKLYKPRGLKGKVTETVVPPQALLPVTTKTTKIDFTKFVEKPTPKPVTEALVTPKIAPVKAIVPEVVTKPKVLVKQADELISHEGAPDKSKVAEVKKQIQEGKDIEPLIIIKEGKKFGIEDGKHRFQAYQELGIKDIPVTIQKPKPPAKSKVKEVISTPKKREIAAQKPVQFTQGMVRESTAFKKVAKQIGIEEPTAPKFEVLNLAEDRVRAEDFLKANKEVSARVAKGLDLPPEGVTQNALDNAVINKALEDKDFKLVDTVMRKQSLRLSRAGQEIVSQKGAYSKDDPQFFIAKVIENRIQKKLNIKFEKGKAKPSENLKNQAKTQRKMVDVKAAKIQSAQSIIDSLIC